MSSLGLTILMPVNGVRVFREIMHFESLSRLFGVQLGRGLG